MTEHLQTSVSENFGRELRSFFVLCLLSLVFGSLAMAFGMQFIITAILAMGETGNFRIFPFLQALAGWAAAVIGFRWILSSARILKGVNGIRREYRALEGSGAGKVSEASTAGAGEEGSKPSETKGRTGGGPGRESAIGGPERSPAGEALTGLIVRMMAHYRENWKTIWRMNLISILGGCIFLGLGVLNLLDGLSALLRAGPLHPSLVQAGPASWPPWSVFFAFLAAGLNLAIGLACLLSSLWFRRFSRAWELRLMEAAHSEDALEKSMGQG
jgi:hypothetical protein